MHESVITLNEISDLDDAAQVVIRRNTFLIKVNIIGLPRFELVSEVDAKPPHYGSFDG